MLKLNNAARNIMVEEFPMTESDIRQIEDTLIGGSKDQAWLYDGICRDFWGIGRFVMGQQWNIEVVECDELKAFMLDSAEEMVGTTAKISITMTRPRTRPNRPPRIQSRWRRAGKRNTLFSMLTISSTAA